MITILHSIQWICDWSFDEHLKFIINKSWLELDKTRLAPTSNSMLGSSGKWRCVSLSVIDGAGVSISDGDKISVSLESSSS